MNQNGFRQLQLNFSGLGCWLTLFVGLWLITTVGLGWILKSIAVLFLVSLILPVLLFIGIRFWLSRNWVQGSCPSCSQPLAGVKSMQLSCPSCGVRLDLIRRSRPNYYGCQRWYHVNEYNYRFR